jgi:hypothetical protein
MFVVARLPRAGLGNMLSVWAKAFAFARLNTLPLFTSSWVQPRIGPILRRETTFRFYWGVFRRPLLSSVAVAISKASRPVVEPPVSVVARPSGPYVFNVQTSHFDFFGPFREHRDAINEALNGMLRPRYARALARSKRNRIAVHVRCGDFQPLKPSEEFGKQSLVRAPIEYFTSRIAGIRKIAGCDIPVSLFSDGRDDELKEILRMPNVTRIKTPSDPTDMLSIANSDIILSSPSSTFGYWAAFLSEAAVLRHKAFVFSPLRPAEVRERCFEGPVGDDETAWPEQLVAAIAESARVFRAE